MSWLASDNPRDSRRRPKRPGRRKEEGGHQRTNISIDKYTFGILQQCDNKSRFIEYAVQSQARPPKVWFYQPNETTNDDLNTFKNATTFVWMPKNDQDNAILGAQCYFQYYCSNGNFQFRIVINGIASDTVRLEPSRDYSLSSVMHFDFCPDGGIKIPPNQSKYEIEFQFAPESSSNGAYVKDINLFLVTDDMPACCHRQCLISSFL